MIDIKQEGSVAVITFDDGKVNVLNHESLSRLGSAFDECREAGAILLRGQGKCFSAGLDLKILSQLEPVELSTLLELFSTVLQKIIQSPCPVVAAVNGHAIAGGAVITLCCDTAIGAQGELKIGLSEVAVGMPLPTFVVELARQRLNPTKLVEALLFGKLYGWQGGLEAGYLHHTAQPEELSGRSLEIAHHLAQLPKQAYLQTKKALWAPLPKSLGSEAMGSFLTAQAQQHMSKFT